LRKIGEQTISFMILTRQVPTVKAAAGAALQPIIDREIDQKSDKKPLTIVEQMC
jgi:hypothetical protein